MPSSPFYSYCFVRTDLPGPVQTVQAGHAWWQTACMANKSGPLSPNKRDCNFVLIGVADEATLIKTAMEVEQEARTPVKLFYENGPPNLGFTAFATEPLQGSKRLYFQKYPLLREPNASIKDEEPSTSDL